MLNKAEAAQPITGRGIGYKLFTASLIPSMGTKEMARVYRLLRHAREQGIIPWGWIVDETRSLEKVSAWNDPEQYARVVARSYRRDFWNQQPVRCEVWSEKGTVRGVLAPVLDHYGVGFRVMHGFSSATAVHEVAQDGDGRDLIVLYVGDYDPSGLFMSKEDLPARVARYDGDHIKIRRIAIVRGQTRGLPSFPASDKRKEPRYEWFVAHYGKRCWELDAMDPNDLRDCVEAEIKKLIEPVAWARCELVNKAEQASLRDVLKGWGAHGAAEEAKRCGASQGAPPIAPKTAEESERHGLMLMAMATTEADDDALPPFYREALAFIGTFTGSPDALLSWWRSKAKDRAKLAMEDQTRLSQLYMAKFNGLFGGAAT
jgi:hypothetical protein